MHHYISCFTIQIKIMIGILSVLIGVLTVYNGYQMMTKIAASKERVKEKNMGESFQD